MTGGKSQRPYGTWPSPLAAADLASAGVRYGLCRMDGGELYWSELRPEEGPRSVICRRGVSGHVADVLPRPFSARSRVHEYGGGEFAVLGGRVVFVNEADQDLYLVADGGAPARLTEAPDWRFADMAIAPGGGRVLAVGERHETGGGMVPPQNAIVSVPLPGEGGKPVAAPDLVLAGRDFYAAPRFSPDGSRLAWLAWDLPHMPWEAAELWVAEVAGDGGLVHPRLVAGGAGGGAFQPEWSGDGVLHFVADHGDWGNLHVLGDDGPRCLLADEAEYGRPLWQFGMASFGFAGEGTLVASCWREGRLEFALVDRAGRRSGLDTPLTRLDSIAADAGGIAILGGDDTTPPGVWLLPLGGGTGARIAGPRRLLDPEDVSAPRTITVATDSGPLHALYYPPVNGRFEGLPGERPPLVVSAHGGPTAMAKRGLDLERQYWTTRGFAFLDVDYRGSFGYGRAYVRALDGAWGVLDAADAVAAAGHVAAEGLADPERVVIMGGSAGGLTVLNALAGSREFAAGASFYGVADLASLATDTHKFEAGYLYALMGAPSGDTEALDAIFRERSPLAHADRIAAPMIFLQGLDDRVVPPSQSRVMAASLRARGVPVTALEFEGEGHGFRKPETVIRALQATHAFFARILGLEPAEALPPIDIDNL